MGSRSPLVAAAVLALAAALAPSAARAQAPPSAPSAEDRASARAMAVDADKKIAAGDYAGAADSFAKAYAFEPAPTLKVARAHALLKLGRMIEAQADLLDAARSEPRPGEPPSWGEARNKADEEAEAMMPRIPLLSLGFTGAPADKVTLKIDGLPLAVATLGAPHAVNPGAHTVRAEAEGYIAAEQVVTMAEGDLKTIIFPLARNPNAPPPVAAAAPPTETPMQPTVQIGPPLSHPVELPSNVVSDLGWAGTAVFGATATVTGIVAILQANSVKSQCKDNVCPTSSQSEANTSLTLGNVSTVAFVGAGACLLLGILAHRSAPHRTTTGFTIDVVMGPGSVGAYGRF